MMKRSEVKGSENLLDHSCSSPTHLKHVGYDGSFALDVDAARAVVLPDRGLNAGQSLKVTRNFTAGGDEAPLVVPLLWERLKVLEKTRDVNKRSLS